MLYLLFIVTTLFMVWLGKTRTGTIFNPLTFYMVFWGFWTVVSLSNPYMLYEVSIETYLMIWVSTASVGTAFLLLHRKRKIEPNLTSFMLKGSEFLNTKKFLSLQLLTFFILFYFYRKYEALLTSSGIVDARKIVYENGLLFDSYAVNLFYTWVITTIVYGSIILLLSNFIVNGQKKLALYVALSNGVLFGLIGYGRLVYFQLICYTIIGLCLKFHLNKKYKTSIQKIRKRTKLLIAVILTATVYIMNVTSARRIGIESASFNDYVDIFLNHSVKDFVVYFTGSFRALDYFLTSDMYEKTGYTLGRSALGGIEEMINPFFVYLSGGSTWQTANATTATFTVEPLLIGSDTWYNAFYTNVMNFYLDGGIAFVAMCSFLFGAAISFVYNRYLENSNLSTFSLVVFLTYHSMASEFRWSFTSPTVWITIAWIVWLHHRHNRLSTVSVRKSLNQRKLSA